MITMQELRDKIAMGVYVQGKEEEPHSPPLGLLPPDPGCKQCRGHGWRQSEITGRWHVCNCTIETFKPEIRVWTDGD